MDNLVLLRVAAVLDRSLRGLLLRHVRDDGPDRLALVFESPRRSITVVVSLRHDLPWIGTPPGRAPRGGRRPAGGFAALCAAALDGSRLESIEKDPAERLVRVRFAGGRQLAAELVPHAANLVMTDAAGSVVGSARRPRSSHERLEPGRPYAGPGLPGGRLDPFGLGVEELDRALRGRMAEGLPPALALQRGFYGLSAQAAELVIEEAHATDASAAEVLFRRLTRLLRGEEDPCIAGGRLLPWSPPAGEVEREPDAASTAGRFHDRLEEAARVEAHRAALGAIVRREVRRLWDAERKARADEASFQDPALHQRRGEALLAGVSRARRAGDLVWVPDPYAPEPTEIAVPVPAGIPPGRAAERHFAAARRSRRGIEIARRRAQELATRRARLEQLAVRLEDDGAQIDIEAFERSLRQEGIAVGLTRAGGARARAAARHAPPRVEGVRLFTTADGMEVLVGKTGRDNQRLTFRLASPEDMWLHAQGVPGAHVVLRTAGRREIPPASLEQAAALAAWYSDARQHAFVDVTCARRKHVKPLRGAAPGTVTVKRSATVRVRPHHPEVEPGAGPG